MSQGEPATGGAGARAKAAIPRVLADLKGRTVIYGGSFDPPHMGHQMACLLLLEAMGADAVLVVPAAAHADGKALSPHHHRLAMAELLVAGLGRRCQVDDVEQHLPAPNTTYATWQALQARRPGTDFAIGVGSDLWPDLGRWHEAEALWQAVPVALIGRMGTEADAARGSPPVLLPNLQSRAIRALLGSSGSVAGLVPTGVARYIEQHGLYRPSGISP